MKSRDPMFSNYAREPSSDFFCGLIFTLPCGCAAGSSLRLAVSGPLLAASKFHIRLTSTYTAARLYAYSFLFRENPLRILVIICEKNRTMGYLIMCSEKLGRRLKKNDVD